MDDGRELINIEDGRETVLGCIIRESFAFISMASLTFLLHNAVK
jgi:hypothetical protein